MKVHKGVTLAPRLRSGALVGALVCLLAACSGGGDDEGDVLVGEVVESESTSAEVTSEDSEDSNQSRASTARFEIGTTYTLTVDEESAMSTLTIPAGSVTFVSLEGVETNVSDVQLVSSDSSIVVSTGEPGDAIPVVTAAGEPVDVSLALRGIPGDRATLLITSELQPDAAGEGDAPAIVTDAPLISEGQTGLLGGFDGTDVFALAVSSGDVITMSLSAEAENVSGLTASLMFNGEGRGSVSVNAGGTEELQLVTAAGEEGMWFIEVKGAGAYQIAGDIEAHPDGGGGRGDAGEDIATALAVEPGTFPGLMGDSDRDDLYTFDVAASATIDLTLRNDPASTGGLNLRVMVEGNEVDRIAAQPGGGESLSVSLVNEAAGTAVIEIWGSNARYEIDLETGQQTDGGLPGDAGEDGLAQAIDGPGELIGRLGGSDSQDHYRVAVEAGSLPFTLTSSAETEGSFSVLVRSPDGDEIGRVAVAPGQTGSLDELEIEEAGTIQIEVWNASGTYTIQVGDPS